MAWEGGKKSKNRLVREGDTRGGKRNVKGRRKNKNNKLAREGDTRAGQRSVKGARGGGKVRRINK